MIEGVDTTKITRLLKDVESSATRIQVRKNRPEPLSIESEVDVKNKTQPTTKEDTNKWLGPNPVAKELKEAEVSIDAFLNKIGNRTLRFQKDENTGKMIIQIVNTKTDEVERQIPPQEFLEMVANLNKVSAELLKDLPKFI